MGAIQMERLLFWNMMTPEQQDYARRFTTLRTFEKGTVLQTSCAGCLGLVNLVSGSIRAYVMSDSGREVSLFYLNPGDSCVLTATCVLTQTSFDLLLVVEEECQMLVLNADVFKSILHENTQVQAFIYKMMADRYSKIILTLHDVMFSGYDRRLASFLVSYCERTGKTEICMTHEQVARHTSSAREVAARMLKKFEGDGLLTLRRGTISVKDLQQLKNML